MTALHISFGGSRRLPIETLLSSIPSLPRHVLNRLVEDAIERLDQLDGDPDFEPDGDELDDTGAEDDFVTHGSIDGYPGCPISDPDYGADEEGEADNTRPAYGARKSKEVHRRRIRRTRCDPSVTGGFRLRAID